jgi:hypothetical protein
MEVSAGARAEMSKNSGAALKEPVTQKGAPDLGAPEKKLKTESKLLRAGKFVSERDVTPEGLVGGDEQAAVGGAGVVGTNSSVDVTGVEGDVGVLRRGGITGPDRSDVEDEWSWAGNGLGESAARGEEEDGKLKSK